MKIFLAVLIDLFDFTIGRLLFVAPFVSELMGTAFCFMMFGPKALWYLVETIDISEQFDGFLPTATFIALAAAKDNR